MLCFADLKRYKFTYLFAFPALHSDPSWRHCANVRSKKDPDAVPAQGPITRLSGQETAALVDCVQTWRYSVDSRQHGFFLARKRQSEDLPLQHGNAGISEYGSSSYSPGIPGTSANNPAVGWLVGPLSGYEKGFFEGVPLVDRYICFADPSNYAEYPGWMLRNLLIMVRRRWKLDRVQVLCYRDVQARRDAARSIILSLELNHTDTTSSPSAQGSLLNSLEMPKITGWERNRESKVTSRVANLGDYMDPQRYVERVLCRPV